MAPKGRPCGTKRTAQKDVAEVAAKQPRLNPSMQAVCDVVDGSDLPDAVRAMLLACTPAIFESYASERHVGQKAVMRMIGEVVDSAVAKLQVSIDAAEKGVADLDAVRDELQAKVAEMERRREDAAQNAEARRIAAMRASADVVEADKALASMKEKEQADGEGPAEDQRKLTALRKALEIFNEESPNVLPATILTTLESVTSLVSLDSSLMKALPDACSKKPSERGAFDKIALEQFEQCAKAEMQKLSTKLEEAAPAMQACAAAVESAKDALEAALQLQRVCSQECADAGRALEEATVAVNDAKIAQGAHEPRRQAASKAAQDAQQKLQSFQAHTVQCFETFLKQERSAPEKASLVHSPEAAETTQATPMAVAAGA